MGYYHKVPKIEGYTRNQITSFIETMILINDEWREKAFKRLISFQKSNEKLGYKSHDLRYNKLYICKNKNCLMYNKIDNIEKMCSWCSEKRTLIPRGFSKNDALIMTTIYRDIFKYYSKNKRFIKTRKFTNKEKAYLKRVLPRYSAQIASISNPDILKNKIDEYFKTKLGG